MRRRILVIAEAANPEWVSVPLIGWSLARALADIAEVHLITQVRNRGAILRAGLEEGRDFTAIDNEAMARPLWQLAERMRMGQGRGWTVMQALGALSYPSFERAIWRRFGPGLRAGEWDLVHRITPLSPTNPSPLAPRLKAAGVPFVLGPLNGGVPWPRAFDAERRAEREWLSYVRGAYKLMPGRGRTLEAAAAIVAGSRHTASELPERQRHKVVHLPENAVDPARFPALAAPRGPRAPGPLRACFIGRMVPYKGPDMVLDAAEPLLRDGRMSLDLIGDGPLMPALRARAAAIGPGVTLHGWLGHTEVAQVAGRGDVLAFPSIREFGGGVVLEAMAMGLVPVVVDYAGPAELVTAATGVKLPLGPRADIVRDLRAALERMAADPAALAPMAEAGRRMVASRYTWAAKARQVSRIHDWARGHAPRPDFDLTGETR
ncbi:glycosyltransferase family 4 protein [Wenxinia saemankumensis]|uniref:Glycosyltransferase involved in cell wall bisynthesis n=1 Tax=Wenxinia saemankumensis TaxID=1447782 RepID=A0A1M6FZU2_9RHOB|nr:glycosyltransferase family 4 protein [Wenxinia saemankumensis]SHJ03233.1 Glycosyltransferase involved in cell wall bisynthesis [Wenxinia saemankumensis]